MARFKPGQQVVCVRPDKNFKSYLTGKSHNFGPKNNEIVTIESYPSKWPGFVMLKEYVRNPFTGNKSCYEEKWFEPLMDITELTEILEHQTQEI